METVWGVVTCRHALDKDGVSIKEGNTGEFEKEFAFKLIEMGYLRLALSHEKPEDNLKKKRGRPKKVGFERVDNEESA